MGRNGTFACLILLVVSTSGLGQDQSHRASIIASLRFDSDGIGQCLAAISKFQIQATGEPRERLTISCEGKRIAAFETAGNFIDWRVHHGDGNRLFVRWERGTGRELTVFKTSKLNTGAKPIFDKWETYVPEIIDFSDVLLVHTGARFVGALKTPTQTDIYRWDGTEYKLEKSWNWGERMRYEDRFCVLDPNAQLPRDSQVRLITSSRIIPD